METTMARRWLVFLGIACALGCGEGASMDFGGDGTGGDDDPLARGGRNGSGGQVAMGSGGASVMAGTGGATVMGTGGALGSGGAMPAGTGGARPGTGGAVPVGTGGSMSLPGTGGAPAICAAPKASCHGACLAVLGTDVNNCGGCDAKCPGGSVCHDGKCYDSASGMQTNQAYPMCPETGEVKKSSACGSRKLNGHYCSLCANTPTVTGLSGYDVTITPCLGGSGICVKDCNDCS